MRDGSAIRQPRSRPSADLHDQLHFHRRIQWQLGYADCRTRMRAFVAEHLGEQVGGPVDDARLAIETRSGRDEADDLDHPGHGVDADQRVHRRQCVERADPRHRLGVLRADLGADLAGPGQLSGLHRQLPRGVDQVAGSYRRYIRGQWRNHRRKRDTKLPEPGGSSHLYLGRFKYATCCSPVGPGSTETNSQPSAPHWSRICLVAWVSSGTVTYSHAMGWLMTRAYRSALNASGQPKCRGALGLACDGGIHF